MMTDRKLTVMGTGRIDGPGSMFSPPSFDDNLERLVWREGVNDSSENVLACAADGEKKSKVMVD